MKNKRVLIFGLIMLIIVCGAILFAGVSSCNSGGYVEAYTADVTIDKNGNITVDEWIVTNYRYLGRDVLTGKNHYNNPLFNGISYDN